MKKGLILKFAAAAMLLLAMSFSCAMAKESDFVFDAATGTVRGYTGSKTELEIPETIGGVQVQVVDPDRNGFSRVVSLHIPSGVKTIDIGLGGCGSLEKLSFAAGSRLESLGSFAYMQSLREVILPDSLTSLNQGVFFNCTGLVSVNIPKGVTKIPYEAFSGCTALESVAMHDGVRVIDHWAFNGCAALKKIYLPRDLSFLSSDAFPGCDSLTVYVFKNTDAHKWVMQDGLDYEFITAFPTPVPTPSPTPAPTPSVTLGPSEIKCELVDDQYICITKYIGRGGKVVIPETVAGMDVIAIGDEAFAREANLTEVYIPASVQSIGNSAFLDCPALTKVSLNRGLETIGYYAFSGCEALSDITLPYGVKDIGQYAFADCYALKRMEIPNSMDEILFAMFTGCKSLETVVIPDSVKAIGGGAFRDCVALEEIALPEDVTIINEYLFYNCPKLSKFSMSGKVDKIYDAAFYNCTALTEISLPESVSLISTTAFDGCSKLTASVIRGSYAHDWCVENNFPCMPIGDDPASPYKYRYIDANTIALTGYTGSDTKISLPETIEGRTVAAIDASAFANTGLQEIVLHGAIETIGEKAFAGCSQLSVRCTGDGFPVMAADAFDRGTVIALAKEIPAFVCDPALDADLSGLFDEWRTEDMAWSSADASIATVSGGVVSPVGSGVVQICAEWQNVTLKIPVNVQLISGPVLVLPEDVEIIHREAFMGTTAERIIVPDGCKTIGVRAFADSETLMLVDVPEGVQIAADAIENSPNAHIIYRSK